MNSFVGFVLTIFWMVPQMAAAQWVPTNGPGGGSISALFVAGNGRVYAGTGGHGVYLSTDEGLSWLAANIGMENAEVSAIGSTGGYLFAASNEQNDRISIYRSGDGGMNWTLCTSGLPNTMGVSSIATSGDTVFAGLWGQYAGEKYGILVSTDDGNDWRRLDSNFTSVVLSLLYTDGKLFVGTADSGVYVTTDFGKCWTKSSDGLFYFQEYNFYANIYDIRKVGNDLFIAAGGKGVYRSADGGNQWSPVSGTFTDQGIVTSIVGSGGNIYAVGGNSFTGVGMSGSGVWYGIIRSTDSGSTWELMDSVMSSNDIHCVAIDSSVVLAGTDYGIDRSTDGGESWSFDETGLPAASSPSALLYSNGILIAALNDGGMSLSSDGGETWNTRDVGLQGVISPSAPAGVKSLPPVSSICSSSSGEIIAATASGLYRYESQRQIWAKITNVTGDSDFISLFETTVGLFANTASGSIYRSTDSGADWQSVGNGIPAIARITSMQDMNGTILGTSNGILYESSDGGVSWSPTNTNLKEIIAIATQSGTVYASTYTYYSPPTMGIPAYPVGAGIYMSTDVGKTWAPINSGLPFINYYPELTSLFKYGNHLFAAGQGVYVLSSSGEGWIRIDSSRGFDEINCLSSDGNYLYEGISGYGVWRAPIVDLGIDGNGGGQVSGYRLSQNYPNPFNPSTVITYDIPKPSHVTLIIYDILGRVVATLVNTDKSPGRYQAMFDGSRLTSGVYFYRLQAGNYTATKKLVLVK